MQQFPPHLRSAHALPAQIPALFPIAFVDPWAVKPPPRMHVKPHATTHPLNFPQDG